MDDALYQLDGDRYVPDPRTTGPWDPGAQHGGAPAALVATVVEAVAAPAHMRVVRLTYELLRPVPVAPLRARTEVLRPGRKVQLVQASLVTDDDTEVVRAIALRTRTADLPLPAGTIVPDDPLPGPDGVEPFAAATAGFVEGPAFHSHAVELRFVEGAFDQPGPSAAWVRLRLPVVAGEAPSPTARVAAAADFGNGFSGVLPRPGWLYINPDLTIHLHREPVGEWVALRSVTWPTGDGVGLAESSLHDRDGRIGRAAQSLLLDRP